MAQDSTSTAGNTARTAGKLPVTTLAARTAEARRKLVTMFRSDIGRQVTLDLIGVSAPTEGHLRFAHVAQHAHADTLAEATLFLADSAMVDLIDTSAPSMPDQELQATDTITPQGFCYFADLLPDRSGTLPLIPIRGFSWSHLDAGHPLAGEDHEHPYVLLTFYVPVRETLIARGFISEDDPTPANAPALIANSTVMWRYDSLIGEVFGHVPPSEAFTPGFYQRVAAAFWTLVQQPGITSTSHAAPGQPTDQRRARRSGITNPTAPVSVVTLHRPPPPDGTRSQPSGGEEGRKMKVRSATRGHWRRQYYASIESHRHIWIEPFWRGPEGGRIQGAERVFLARGDRTQ